MAKKVVVTGIGMISPLGVGKKANWQSVLANANSIVKLANQGAEGEFAGIDC